MKNLREIQFTPMMKYLLYSVLVTFIDTAIVWVLYRSLQVNLVTANSIGVITGFIIHYTLSSKSVFQTELGLGGFVIYFGTFLLGLIIADGLIYLGEHYIFHSLNANMSFLLSKGISIIIPFFFLYLIRKMLFDSLKNKTSRS